MDSGAHLRNHTETLEREARERAKEEADEWAAADVEGGDGGAPKPLKRLGWPTPDKTDGPIINAKDRESEKRASVPFTAWRDAKHGEAAHTASPPKQEDHEVKEEAFTGTFSQSMSERLAMLEKDDGEGGGVRLPSNLGAP